MARALGQAVFVGLLIAKVALAQEGQHSAPFLEVPKSPTLWFEAGLLTVDSEGLEGYQLVLARDGLVVAQSPCVIGEGCALSLDEEVRDGLLRRPEAWSLALISKTISVEAGRPLPEIGGARPPQMTLGKGRLDVVFSEPLFQERSLDTAKESWLLVPRLDEALDRITCEKVLCRRTDKGIVMLQPAPNASSLRMTYTLKPGFFRSIGGRLTQSETLTFRLERCAVIPPNWPLLAGVRHQRLPLALPAECPVPARLEVLTSPPTGAWIRGEAATTEGGLRVLEVRLDEVPRDIQALTITLLDADTGRRIGSARVEVSSDYVPHEVRIVAKGLGPLGFIPSNRDAVVQFGLPDPAFLERIEIVDRPGFYRVRREAGAFVVRGEPGVAGSVPLRFAYHPRGTGQSGAMAYFDSDAVFPVRTVNIPVPLMAGEKERFIEVRCGPPGQDFVLLPGVTNRLAYEKRETCRITFDLRRIPPEVGVQRLRVRASDFERILTLEHADSVLTVSVGAGDKQEYDVLQVAIAHDMSGDHYVLGADQRLGEEVRYRVLLSDDYVRISATTSLPTGLFRFGRAGTGDSVPLSAGALVRLSYVQQDGRDFPVTLEAGMFGTNLSGKAHLSIVGGLGLGIPVLNPGTAVQASFNIHAWFEYSPTRAKAGEGPIAFLFGPSFTIGRISTTF